jgi:hypothetical protein
MRLLVIICSHEMNKSDLNNIVKFNGYLLSQNITVDYCGISNQDDFNNYEDIISFKYKIINKKKQLSKICDFITKYNSELDYDWYIKTRTDLMLLEPINFDILLNNAINARARQYVGPQQIPNGSSVGGEGMWSYIKDYAYNNYISEIVLDDMIYIFSKDVKNKEAFNIIPEHDLENEWTHSNIWKSRNIALNVIGIYAIFTKYNVYSGNINC